MTTTKMAKLAVTFGIALYAIAVPALELNDTHLFNAAWPAHARLHEAWQLLTNSALGAWALWCIWGKDDVRTGAFVGIVIMGAFIASDLLAPLYGGSMVHPDGTRLLIFGVDIGFVGFGLGAAATLGGLVLDRVGGPPRKPGGNQP